MERRAAAVVSDGQRSLTGKIVLYGVPTSIDGGIFTEQFEPGAFGDLSDADLILNFQHERSRPLARTGAGLTLVNTETELAVHAVLPETREADDALTLVRSGIVRGLSVEFFADEDSFDGSLRRITKARIADIGLVDRPAYPDATVEVRAAYERHQRAPRRRRIWL